MEYSPLETLKPANRNVASDGIGMHALSATIRAKIPGRPSLSITSTANCTIGSVSEAAGKSTRPVRLATGRAGSAAAAGLDARKRQRGDALLGARRGPVDGRLGPQHLEDHDGLV